MIPQDNRPALLDSPRVVDASAAAQPGPGQAAKAPNSEQAFFRLDLMRSLQLHRRLALSIAAVGFVLGLIFYLSGRRFIWRSAWFMSSRLRPA